MMVHLYGDGVLEQVRDVFITTSRNITFTFIDIMAHKVTAYLIMLCTHLVNIIDHSPPVQQQCHQGRTRSRSPHKRSTAILID
jgi:hypothetical protein